MSESSTSQLKVLFVCGCAEPGKDGVGDYTRRLGTELVKQNCKVAVAAVNDRFVEDSMAEASDGAISVTRLNAKSTARAKRDFLKRYILSFEPNWISLQYVPYAFQHQGVPISFARSLGKLRQLARWHVMFHEVHLGGVLSVKNHLIKYGQIKTVKRLVQTLKPKVVHTSNFAYREMLEQLMIDSKILGLFGNIPILAQPAVKPVETRQSIKAVYFGASPKEYDFHIFANTLKPLLSEQKLSLHLEFLGRQSPLRNRFIQYLLDACQSDLLEIEDKGEKSPVELSQLFSAADFAIARVKPSLLGKSGAALTLLEHGLKLWVPMAESQAEIELNFDYRTEQCFADLPELLENRKSFVAKSRLNEVAEQFLKDLRAVTESFANREINKH